MSCKKKEKFSIGFSLLVVCIAGVAVPGKIFSTTGGSPQGVPLGANWFEPTIVGTFSYSNLTHRVKLAGNNAYIGTGQGLWVADVTDPASPNNWSYFESPMGGYVKELSVIPAANLMLTAEDNYEMGIWDISDPLVPSFLNYSVRTISTRRFSTGCTPRVPRITEFIA
jgi:hypothetical protein